MSRSDRGVYLAYQVDEFKRALSPADCEEFNEILVRVYNDPKGKRTGAVERMRPPTVYWVYRSGSFGIMYRLYRISGDEWDRIEVFDVMRVN